MSVVLQMLQRYWPVLLMGLIAWAWGNHQYDAGFSKRDGTAKSEALAAAEAQRREDDKVIANYVAALDKADRAAEVAAQAAADSRKKADDFYAKWQEVKRNVPLTVATAPARPFTVGFVGLFNLSVKGAATAPGGMSADDVAAASGADFGPAGIDLSQAAKVTADDLLEVDKANYRTLHLCLADRAALKNYVESLHAAGLYR